MTIARRSILAGMSAATIAPAAALGAAQESRLIELIHERKQIANTYSDLYHEYELISDDPAASIVLRTEAKRRFDRASQKLDEIERAIVDYPPADMAEVAAKAKFALDEEITDTDELIDRFLRSLMPTLSEV